MNKLTMCASASLFITMMTLLGYGEGIVHVADVSIKPDLKNVTYYKAKGMSITGVVTYRWVLLTPQETENIINILSSPKIDQTKRINRAVLKEFEKEHKDNKILLMVLNDFSGRKIKRVVRVLKKEKPSLIDKLAVTLPRVEHY